MGINITSASLSINTGLKSPKDKLLNYEKEIAKLPQVNMPVRHDFISGVYSRTITINKGIAFCGHTHRYECINIISSGKVLVATEEGSKEICAPYIWKSGPGVKRVGLALEDVTWTTIHSNPDNIQDIDEIEDFLIIDQKETMLELQKLMDKESIQISTRTYKEQLENLGE